MRDKRPVDELSIAELERILVIRKRESRQARLREMEQRGRRIPAAAPLDVPPEPLTPPERHEAAAETPPLELPVTYDITDDVPRFEDELEAEQWPRRKPAPRPTPYPNAYSAQAAAPRSRTRALWDKLLLAIEVVGIIGIIAVLVYGGYLIINENDKIEALEQKSAEVQREADAMRATPTPRPDLALNLSDVVLPGGHYSPDQTGGEGAFNLDEVPESLRPMALAQLTAPQAERGITVTANSPTRIVVDTARVDIDASIYGGDDWYQLIKGVGHYENSANPGEPRNMVLTAHNDIYGEIFRDIQYLNPGDEIRIQANNGQWYTYVVYDRFPVEPTDTWVLNAGNDPIVTLITCHPYRVDTQRMIVVAQLVSGPVS